MTPEQGVEFLKGLGVTGSYLKETGWLVASCPLAKWTHQNHSDHSPSFGLLVKEGERSFFSCFACRNGSAEELLQTIEMYAKGGPQYDFLKCYQILNEEPLAIKLPDYEDMPTKSILFEEWPTYWLDSFKSVEWYQEALEYLAHRGIGQDTILEYRLKFDPKKRMVIFPYFDVFGRFAGARGRSILPNVTGSQKHYDYTWQGANNCRMVWFNEKVLNLEGPVVVVEGQFDCLKTAQAYRKVVANLSAKPTIEKLKKLTECSWVIQIPDRDEAGVESTKKYQSMCYTLGIKHDVIWLPDDVKDPDECAVGYLYDRIKELL